MDFWSSCIYWISNQSNEKCKVCTLFIPFYLDLIILNISKAPIKRSNVERVTNYQIIFMYYFSPIHFIISRETNLKIRQALPETLRYDSPETLEELKGFQIKCELPNEKLYNFAGTIKLPDKEYPLEVKQVLLRVIIRDYFSHLFFVGSNA